MKFSFDEYRATTRFPALDGLRAIAVFLVFAEHFGGDAWARYSGWLGVHAFFVLSGYLITTLLLRERDATGTISLAAFYVRRSFRLLPMFLLVYVAVMCQSYLAHDDTWTNMKVASPYYLTFFNELAPLAPLKMTWTLGVEWKFYFVWPVLLAFIGISVTSGSALIACCILALAAVWFTGFHMMLVMPWNYLVMLYGSAMAMLLHNKRSFDILRPLTSNTSAIVLLAALCFLHYHSRGMAFRFGEARFANIYGVVVALLLPGLISGTLVKSVLSWRPFVFVGHRSYTLYLIQLMAAQATMGLLPWVHFGPNFLPLCFAFAIVASDFLYTRIEKPMTRLGHQLASRFHAQQTANVGEVLTRIRE